MTAGLIDALLGLYNVNHSVMIHTNQVRRVKLITDQFLIKLTAKSLFIFSLVLALISTSHWHT